MGVNLSETQKLNIQFKLTDRIFFPSFPIFLFSYGGAAIVVGSGVALLYASAGLAIWSLVVYIRKIWKVLLR